MASIVNTSTKFFLDTMAGSPVLNNAAGSLIALLDAVLVTGFGIKAVTSLSIAGGIATLGFSAPASAATPECVVLLSGVTGTYASLNGEQRIKTASATTATFATDLPDGTATLSSGSFKIAPLGWEKVYTGTNKAVFRPLDPASTRPYLRVLDTAASPATAFHARVTMFETMSDVDTGTNMAPPNALVANGGYWWKTAVNTTAAVPWTIVGDSRALYFLPCTHNTTGALPNVASSFFFGDLKSYRSGDAYCATLVAATADVSATPVGVGLGVNSGTSYLGWVMRAPNGLGVARNLAWRGVGGASTGVSGNDANALGPFPAPANNGLLLAEIVVGTAVVEANGPRGIFPGAVYVPQNGTAGYFPRGLLVDGNGQWFGSKLLAVPGGGNMGTATNDFAFFIDATKNWRA